MSPFEQTYNLIFIYATLNTPFTLSTVHEITIIYVYKHRRTTYMEVHREGYGGECRSSNYRSTDMVSGQQKDLMN